MEGRQGEEERLKRTIEIAERQLEEAQNTVEGKRDELLEAKRDVRENATHSIGNLWSSEDFEALAELSQCINPITEIVADCEEEKRKITRLKKMIKSPYFARIDFQFEDEEESEKIYIGRSSLIEKKSQERLIYDWRSPIASVFYRFLPGEAYYDAPVGRITGKIKLKRQYEIENSVLKYFFDANVQINDEFLRELLSHNTSPQMKAIVETIQKEQDIVIRDMDTGLLMVQGVAGSGKTSIALHRAAYLMYQGLQSKLSANNIMIISPNTVFEQYISNVLPELGEENVNSIVFEDILHMILKTEQIQSKNDFLEKLVTNTSYKKIRKASMEFKMSEEFQTALNQLLKEIPSYQKEINVVELYKKIFDERDYLARVSGDSRFAEMTNEIKIYTKENLESGCLYYDDAIVIAYLHLKIHGVNGYGNIKQVVIDEAQDYYFLQYEIFHLLFPNAKFTILGDVNQTLAKQEDISLYKQIQKILNKKNATLVTLGKSFRCTNEILNFSLKFIEKKPEFESFNRSGDDVQITVTDCHEKWIENIISEVNVCHEKGFKTVGLICKTEKNSITLFEALESKIDVQLIRNESSTDLQGVFSIPVYMSKGLEFDAVLICDVDSKNYYDEDDRNLLYVGCTRALHRLSIFCEGELSSLI